MATKQETLKFCKGEINKRVNMRLLGNSDRGMKEFAIDLLHSSKTDIVTLAAGTFLHKTTLRNLMDGTTKHPRYDTIERVFKFFAIDMTAVQVDVNAKFQNRPKKQR